MGDSEVGNGYCGEVGGELDVDGLELGGVVCLGGADEFSQSSSSSLKELREVDDVAFVDVDARFSAGSGVSAGSGTV